MSSLWYFSVNGKAEGPVGEEVIIEGLKSGRFTLVDLVFREGQQGWCTLGEVEKFREVFNALPIPQPPAPVSEPIVLEKFAESLAEKPKDTPSRASSVSSSTASSDPKSPSASATAATTTSSSKAKSTVDDIFASVLPKAQRTQETPPMSHYNHPAPASSSSAKPHWSTEPAWVILKNKAGGGFEQTGPYSVVQILDMIATGEVKYSHYSWRPGYKRWVRIGNLPEFDRRKRDREGDPVNQIIPLPDQAQNVPALSRDDLMGQIERLRRPPATRAVSSSQERPPEATGQDLARLSYEIPEVVKPEAVVATPPPVTNTPPETHAPLGGQSKLVGGAETPIEPSVSVQLSGAAVAREVDESPEALASEQQVEQDEEVTQTRPRSITGKAARLGFAAALATFAVITFFEFQLRNEANDATSAKKEDATSKSEDAPKPSAPDKVVKRKVEETSDVRVADKKPVADPVSPSPAVAVPQPVVAEPTQASTLGVRPLEPSKDAPRVLDIIPLKLTTQPILVFQTDAGIAETIEVKIHGRTGEILDYPAYWERFNVKRTAGEVATLDLSKLGLPRGTYQVVASVGALQDEKTFFVGARDPSFDTSRKAHLKSISAQQVRERRALYYGSVTMEKVASDLASGYQRHRLQPKKWAQFYTGWLASARTSVKDVMSLKSEVGAGGRLAFPVEIAAFQKATERLGAQAREFDLSVSQKRQLAATAESVGADFKRIREELAEFSVNSP